MILQDGIAVERITPYVNRVCMPWENIRHIFDRPDYDKAHVHVIGFSIQVEVISHPDLLRKITGWHIDTKVVSVVEGINHAVVISRGAESSSVYVQIVSHLGSLGFKLGTAVP
jgi:hypothetical protein